MATKLDGYSSKPLVQKLGYKPDEHVKCVNAPSWFIRYLESEGVITAPANQPDWLHAFCSSVADLRAFCKKSELSQITKGLWVSWPKKSSGIVADITEQSFRDTLLPLGWVDTKVCAIDDTWGGLKFLRRKA